MKTHIIVIIIPQFNGSIDELSFKPKQTEYYHQMVCDDCVIGSCLISITYLIVVYIRLSVSMFQFKIGLTDCSILY